MYKVTAVLSAHVLALIRTTSPFLTANVTADMLNKLEYLFKLDSQTWMYTLTHTCFFNHIIKTALEMSNPRLAIEGLETG